MIKKGEFMSTVLMHGPDLDTGEIVEVEVADENVHAYKQAGYKNGAIPVAEAAEEAQDDAPKSKKK